MKIVNPDTTYPPPSNYAQAVVHAAGAERMVISGSLACARTARWKTGWKPRWSVPGPTCWA